MKFRIIILSAFCLLSVGIYAQEDNSKLRKDSLRAITDESIGIPEMSPVNNGMKKPEVKAETEIQQMEIQEIKLRRPFYMPYLPGIGRINEASLMYQYNINDYWEIQAGLNATKFNFPFSTGQAFGTSGAVIYRPNEKLSFRAFGSYAPASAYGFQMSSFGGTIGYEFNDRWGMEVGAERIYDPMRGRWDTRPIAIPYYKFNKTKIGLDVGGILYEIIRSAKFKNQGGNPTIMPGR